jgi:hypothetical protein
MKQLSNIAMLFVAAAAITCAFAFRPAKNAHQKGTDTFYYTYSGNSTMLSDYETDGNWSNPAGSDPGGCNGGPTLPCVVSSSESTKAGFLADITANGTSVVDNNIVHKRH